MNNSDVKLTYKELDEIVIGFKMGVDGCAEKLVDAYDGFIAKYVNLLDKGIIFPDNERMRHFMGLYITKPNVKKYLDQYMYMPTVKATIYSTAHMLAKLLSGYKKAELYAEVVSVLLDMANRYQAAKTPMFHTYVNRVFNYMLKKHLGTMIKDPLVKDEWISYDEEIENKDAINVVETDIVFERIHESIELSRTNVPVVRGSGLNLNWINGVTATTIFKMLSDIDRRILVMYYIEEMDDIEIARELGYGARETINRRRNKAKELIEQYAKNNNLYRLRESSDIHSQTSEEMSGMCREVQVQYQQDAEHKVKTRVYRAGVVG